MSLEAVKIEVKRCGRSGPVFDHVRRFIKDHRESRDQEQLLLRLVDGFEAEEESVLLPFIDVPLLVYGGIRGIEEPAIPLAVATTLLFLGVDLLDDLADGDLRDHWSGYTPSEIQLAGSTLLACLPQIAIAELDGTPERQARMQKILAGGLLKMSAGQQGDLRARGNDFVSPEGVERSVAGKSGEEVALFAALAAELAGASKQLVEEYADLGRAIGTGGQLASDCHELFQTEKSRDVANGTRTLPIALYLNKVSGGERTRFLVLLNRAATDRSALEAVRKTLHGVEILRLCAFVVEVYCQRALGILEKVNSLDPAGGGLKEMIGKISFFQKRSSHES